MEKLEAKAAAAVFVKMGGKKNQDKKKVDNVEKEESEEEFESFVDEEPIAPVSINKYDPYQLKECINDTIVQILEEKDFVEDNTMMD